MFVDWYDAMRSVVNRFGRLTFVATLSIVALSQIARADDMQKLVLDSADSVRS